MPDNVAGLADFEAVFELAVVTDDRGRLFLYPIRRISRKCEADCKTCSAARST